jgi:hypothetical protein
MSDAIVIQMICSKFQIRKEMSFPNALTGFQSTENKNTHCLSILHQTNAITVAYIHAIKINWPYRVEKVGQT